MLISQKMSLKPLLESSAGIHLTAYLVNRGDLVDLKEQLQETIDQCYEWLAPVLNRIERKRFLEPLDSFLQDVSIVKQMKGNIGIFRNEKSFRVLNVPIGVEPTCHVATSFHVKPLLRWLQHDQQFLLLGVVHDSAQLYVASQDSFRLIDTVKFPISELGDSLMGDMSYNQRLAKEEETISWLDEWIGELTKHSEPKLFLAGERMLTDGLAKSLGYKNTVRNPVRYNFSRDTVINVLLPIRKVLSEESNKRLNSALLEFRLAEKENRTCQNIFEIARAAVQGQVKKLIVTDDLNIFGKIDNRTGELCLHPFDLDHEDDDVLDDLAQMVLSRGGEVIIASQDEIPKGRPILAIVNKDEGEVIEIGCQLQQQYEVLQERFG